LMSGRKYGLDVMDLSGLKIIGHGNPDNNLESPFTLQSIQPDIQNTVSYNLPFLQTENI